MMRVVSHSPDLPAPSIRSPTNPPIKAAVRLRDRRERDAAGLTLVDGARELLRAIEAGVVVHEAFVSDDLIRTADAVDAVARLRTTGARCWAVTPAVFAKVAFGDRAEGVVAMIRTPATELETLRLPSDPLLVVAEDVEKPGNLGAILRSADGAGVDALIAASPRTDLFNPNAIRASLGTIFSVPVAAAPTNLVLAWLREHGIRILAGRLDGAALATETDLTGPLTIAVGAEAEGLDPAWSASDIAGIRLPMLGVADSLNVAAASAVLLYEARRQRGLPDGRGRR
jgi:TrmH family RNA methyltransferase